jgi:secondary-alkyl amine dehydrogenase [NAD(P)+]
MTAKPRIVIYGTGQYGQIVTRYAHEKGWSIVAAYNRAGAKVGQDLGRLAGLEKDLGVIVQDCDTANYDNLDADLGVVTLTNTLQENFPAYKRLITAGLNVICHGTEAYYPFGNAPLLATEIDELAKNNRVTFTGSGIWDMSRIWAGILVAGPCTKMNSLYHSSITEAAGQADNPEQVKVAIGTTLTVDEFYQQGFDRRPVSVSYKTIPEHVLHALGYNITDTRSYVEPVIWDSPYYSKLFQQEIPAGHVVGCRIIGEINTREGATAKAEIELREFREGEVEHMYWEVDGLPRTSVRTERKDSRFATAACLFNRISQVISAKPGIVLISEMGPLKPTAL